MAAPVILLIDDEPHVLSAIARDLKTHYHGDYRVVQAASGADGLDAVRDLKGRGAQVALFLVDQRMPGMSGVQFLEQALQLYPDARKVLLTAYADTDAAIASINAVGLDHYLMKPWDPPEERLYPVLDDLLDEWRARAPAPYEGIRVAGTQWSAKAHRIKEFLARNQTPYKWLNVEKSPAARALVEGTMGGRAPLPVLFFPDGSVLADPELPELAERIGLHTSAEQPFYDLVVIGGGPAGLGAAVYGASEGLRTVVVEKDAAGGQAGSSARIENYLGFPQGISGADLTRRATTQAVRFGAELLTAREVTGIRVEDPYRVVTLDDGTELRCHALLLATGVRTRTLDAPGVEELTGASVFYGTAASEAVNTKGGKVFVVGGANSAGQGAVFLSRYAAEVTMLIRGDSLRSSMSKYLIDQIERTKNITVRVNTEVAGALGTEHMEALSLRNLETGDTETVPADAMFIFIGAVPHTDLVADLVMVDEAGFILTGQDLVQDGRRPKGWRPKRDPLLLETSVPGIFAAGDVRHGVVRRVASAVGQGAVAVTLVHKYLESV